jgi:hypothetical protein
LSVQTDNPVSGRQLAGFTDAGFHGSAAFWAYSAPLGGINGWILVRHGCSFFQGLASLTDTCIIKAFQVPSNGIENLLCQLKLLKIRRSRQNKVEKGFGGSSTVNQTIGLFMCLKFFTNFYAKQMSSFFYSCYDY